MRETSYLLLLSKKGKSLKPLKEKFRSLGGFYTGIGYAFPKKYLSIVQEIALSLEEKLHEMPLAKGQTFASMQQSHKSSFFREKLYEIESSLLQYQQNLHLKDLSEQSLLESSAAHSIQEKVLDLLFEKERIQEAIQHAERLEKAIGKIGKSSSSIQFIQEREIHFLLQPPPPIPKLVNFLDENGCTHPFIRKGCTGMVVGAGGVGKTHFLTQLALSIATGLPFLKKYPIEKPGYVFLGLGENTDEDIHRLLRKTLSLFFSLSFSAEDTTYIEEIGKRLAVTSFTGTSSSFLHQRMPTPVYEDFLYELQKKEPEEGWSCIILDPISRFLGADAENDNASATTFIALLERLIVELKGKPTVLFGHHMNKSGIAGTNTDQSAARGSSAITDGVRLQINLEKVSKESGWEKEKIHMRMVKSNFTAFIPDQVLLKDSKGNLHVDTLENTAIFQERIQF